MEHYLFVNLLKLYKSTSNRTPTEDFTTEVLAGVLQSDVCLLDSFINNVLLIPGGGFNVKTQKRYENSIIDMVFENDETICFLENKVDSFEGDKQLHKYAIILSKISKKNVFLRYCTKFNDKKSLENYIPLTDTQFLQFRWVDVFNFFKSIEKNIFIPSFLTFLKDNDMSSIPEFKIEDLIAMKQFSSTIHKMEECFEIIKPKFSEFFGEPYTRDYASLKQVPGNSRYALWRENIIPGEYSEILLAFSIEDCNDPIIYIQCYCERKHRYYKAYIEELNNNSSRMSGIEYEEDEWGVNAWFEKKLSDFISSDNQYKEITDWFIQKMKEWKIFMQNTPLLEWDLPK